MMLQVPHWRGLAVLMLACATQALAQTRAPATADRSDTIDGVPLQQIIEVVSARTGQTFVVDPRVNATIKAPGLKLQEVTFDDLQAILSVHGYTAVPVGSLYKIIPDDNVRQAPVPVIIGGQRGNRSNDQFVTKVLQPRKLSAAAVVTALRPLLPQQATITANPSTNSLIVVASEGDIAAVEAMLLQLETAR
jgi:general secretion pathway protein D